MTTLALVLTIVGGSWVTTTAILGERRVWVQLLLMAVGLMVTLLAFIGIAFIVAQGGTDG